MNILSISVLAVVTVIICVMLKPKNAEISVMLGISCSVIILIGVLTQVSAIVTTINQIIASSGISVDYIVILLKSIGICLVTEFAVNTCKDSGSQSLASNVSLAGKIMVTVTALPLYSDILKTVLSLAGNLGEEVKKSVVIITVVFVLIALSCVCANAEEGEMIYDMSNVFDSLSDDIKQSLQNMGVDLGDFSKLANLSFENVMGEILSLALGNISSPLKGLVNITALLLLCSVISAYNGSLSCDISNSLNITATLCITCAAVVPAVGVIASTGSVICTASNIMLAYVPVMAVIMASSGSVAGSASYYAVMIGAGEGVSQLSSKIIVPLLNMFLGLSITSSVSPSVNLSGFMSMISKSVKWLLGFAMTIFTAVLTFRQLISVSVDNVSTRAVRFTLNSFIPIVGSALSDAYKVVQGSIGLLKSGIGIIVILSVTIVFMPVILQGVMWMFTLWIGKSTAEVLNLNGPAKLLENISSVFSTLIAVLLCIMSIYILSTAAVIMLGGGSS